MTGGFSVEAPTRLDAMALLRALGNHHPWTVQLGLERWVVVGRADGGAARLDVERIVTAWASDRGRPELAGTLVDDPSRVSSRERGG